MATESWNEQVARYAAHFEWAFRWLSLLDRLWSLGALVEIGKVLGCWGQLPSCWAAWPRQRASSVAILSASMQRGMEVHAGTSTDVRARQEEWERWRTLAAGEPGFVTVGSWKCTSMWSSETLMYALHLLLKETSFCNAYLEDYSVHHIVQIKKARTSGSRWPPAWFLNL